jgi:dTDP-4-amino-4,6-dideoxygalactose transaminase
MTSRIYLSPPDMSQLERQLLLEAFDSNWIAPLGPYVDGFEDALSRMHRDHPVCVTSSGSAALHLALILLGVGPGDEVVVPTLTFAATANAVRYVGASPVFVDAEQSTSGLCPDQLSDWLNERRRKALPLPKVVMTVDLYGQPVDYERLRQVLAPHEIPIVQDAAEALGSTYRGEPVGLQGVFGVFSFNGNKIITTSGGGALVAQDPQVISRARKLASQAREPALHYEHVEVGYNYRLSNLLAAIGTAQLQTLAQKVDARREHFRCYRDALGRLPGWTFKEEPTWSRSNRWLTVAGIDPETAGYSRDDVIALLSRHNVEARPTWKPMHCQPVFAAFEKVGGGVAERIFERGICLPSGSSMTAEQRGFVVDLICGLRDGGAA